jgi:thioesterase domain-containing protein
LKSAGDMNERPQEIAAEAVLESFPCTPPQQRCWFLDQLEPGNPALNVAVRWELKGRFSPSSVEQAFRLLIQRHESLRTRFVEEDGAPAQQPMPSADFRLSVIDCRQIPEAQRDAHMMALSQQEARQPFDLTKAPLIRATLFKVAPDQALLLIVIHQSVFDGWSIRILGRELGSTIDAIEQGRTPDLPDLPLQYADYAMWLDEYYTSAGFEAEKTYWLQRLRDLPYFEIDPDHDRGLERTTRGEIVSTLLSPELSDLFDARAKELGCTTFSLGSGIIAAALHRFSGGARDVVFGTQVAGRQDVDLENIIGVFINNLVLRFDAPGDMALGDLAAQANATIRDALINQRMPFHKLVELLNPPRDMTRTPLISINVIIQQAFLEDAAYGQLSLRGVPSPSPGALYDLNFQMIRRPDGWRMSIEFNSDLFERATVQALLDLWKAAFETTLRAPSTRLDALPAPPVRTPLAAPAGGGSPVEAMLRAHPDVADVAVVDRDGRRHAYVTPRPGYAGALEALPESVLAFAHAHLAEQAAPHGVSVVLALPRGAGGALDAAALPQPPSAVARPVRQAPSTGGKPPAAIEQRMAAIWEEVLGVSGVGPDSHFFELGGHSLLAARMLAKVGAAFGRRPPIAALFQSPTLRGFTLQFAGPEETEAAPAAPALPAVRRAWEAIDFANAGGDVGLVGVNHPMLFYRLAQRFGAQRGVVDIQIADPANADFGGRSFESIVADCVSEIRRAQPSGPYALMGLCINGVVALEAARQLRQAGEEVPLVAMIDSWRPGFVRSRPAWQRNWWRITERSRRLGHHFGALLAGRMAFKDFVKSYDFLWAFMSKVASVEGPDAESVQNGQVTALLVEASRSYPVKPYDGRVVLFRSETSDRNADTHLFGWRGLLPEATPIVPVAGWHEDAFNAEGLAAMAGTITRELGAPGDAAR